jgi:hypothetical protein
MLMLDTLKLFVSSAKMLLEVQFSMTTGRLSRPEIAQLLWLEPIKQLRMPTLLLNTKLSPLYM